MVQGELPNRFLDRIFSPWGNDRGSVAVFAALALSFFVGFLLFTVDVGYLFGEKNRYQDAVEAAAMAGAISLCGADPEGVAQSILAQNLTSGAGGGDLPEGYTARISIGYYDESGLEDFSGNSVYGYASFIEEDSMPNGYFANAALVMLVVDKMRLLTMMSTDKEVAVTARSIAYLKRYGMIALGTDTVDTEGNGDIETAEPGVLRFPPQSPAFEQMGFIHANNNIEFSDGSPVADGFTTLTAAGSINGTGGYELISPVELGEMDWVEMATKADEIITRDYFFDRDFRIINENVYYANGTIFHIGFRNGDHGRSYYLDPDGFPDGSLLYIQGRDEGLETAVARRFSLAVGGDQITTCFYFNPVADVPLTKLALGGDHPETVYIYSKGDIGYFLPNGNGLFPAIDPSSDLPNIQLQGVVLWSEGDIALKVTNNANSDVRVEQKVRVVAGGAITLLAGGRFWGGLVEDVYNGYFGPPCPPSIVKLAPGSAFE